MNNVLEGVKILDLSRQLAGPFATMTMGDLGAEIIKVEPPVKGDDSRAWGPFVNGESCYYWSCNRAKKSIVVDLKTNEGKEIIKKLAAEADIMIENFRVGVMERLGLDYEVMKEVNPKLIYCHITGYGEKGPDANRPAVDIAIQANTGLMSITGYPDQEPVKIGVSLCDLATGLFGTTGILAAYINRLKTGKGQKVSVSLMESMISWLVYHGIGYLAVGAIPGKYGSGMANIEPYRAVKTKNGYVTLGVGNDTNFGRLCDVMGMPELAKDPRFAKNVDRYKNRKELIEIIEKFFAECDNKEIEEKMVAKGIPCGAIYNIGEALENEQVKAMGMIVNVPHPYMQDLRMIRTPINFSEANNISMQYPPRLGEHTKEVLKGLGYSEEKIDRLVDEKIVSTFKE